MAKAVICPVCCGKGKIPANNWQYDTNAVDEKTCHGCGGCGWVEVSE